jgi:hypothetical protein
MGNIQIPKRSLTRLGNGVRISNVDLFDKTGMAFAQAYLHDALSAS